MAHARVMQRHVPRSSSGLRSSPPVALVLPLSVVAVAMCLVPACAKDAATPPPSSASGGAAGDGGSGGSGGSDVTEVLLLDDLDDCDPALEFEGVSGTWYAYNATCDGMDGEQVPPAECTGEPFAFESEGAGCRARTTGGGFPFSEADGWGYALIGVRFAAPVDLCAFDGITFSSGGDGMRVKVATVATAGDSDHFGVSIAPGGTGFGWGQLSQEGWGAPADFDCAQVTGFLFQAADPTEFDFWIDDLGLRRGGAGGGGGSGGAGSGGSGAVDYVPRPTEPCDDPDLVWKTGRKTNYTSYPEPGSEECIVYNGCTWAGQFAHCSGVRSEAWVASRDIAAVFPDTGLAGHDLCVRSGDRVMVVTAIDTCGDSDCDGCCTRNKGDADALIDLESYTNARWGLPDGAVEWADLGPNPDACEP